MAKAQKNAAYLNVYIEKPTVERLTKFCEEFGDNKLVTTDKAINMYLDEMERKLKTSK
jgi:Holliday junction resolvase